jgi:translation initiation factor IF-2
MGAEGGFSLATLRELKKTNLASSHPSSGFFPAPARRGHDAAPAPGPGRPGLPALPRRRSRGRARPPVRVHPGGPAAATAPPAVCGPLDPRGSPLLALHAHRRRRRGGGDGRGPAACHPHAASVHPGALAPAGRGRGRGAGLWSGGRGPCRRSYCSFFLLPAQGGRGPGAGAGGGGQRPGGRGRPAGRGAGGAGGRGRGRAATALPPARPAGEWWRGWGWGRAHSGGGRRADAPGDPAADGPGGGAGRAGAGHARRAAAAAGAARVRERMVDGVCDVMKKETRSLFALF